MPGPGKIFEVAEGFRRELLARERRAATEMVRAYGQSWVRIKTQLDGLTRQIAAARAAGEDVNPYWLFQRKRLRTLQGQVETEIRGFARTLGLGNSRVGRPGTISVSRASQWQPTCCSRNS